MIGLSICLFARSFKDPPSTRLHQVDVSIVYVFSPGEEFHVAEDL
jgi:hypothetical protein